MRITKAIIPVAGWGTRRLPITKTIEKCMLPIGNRPVVDYVVQDCIKAGITDIYFIVNQQSAQLRDYYSENIDLVKYLHDNKKDSLLPLITPPTVNFHYIIQPDYEKYGTAIPVSLALPVLQTDESVVVLMGDDCIYRSDNKSEVARIIEAAGSDCAMLAVSVPREDTSKYGVIEVDNNNHFIKIVEKPKPEEAPSCNINVSKYVLNYQAMKLIEEYSNKGKDEVLGEYYITEPINNFVSKGGIIKVIEAEGRFLDAGTVDGWLKANEVVANNTSCFKK